MEKPHKKLDAWKESMQLVTTIYEVTSNFPEFERYGLAGQIRRAAVSIPSNIAEGAARNTKKEFRNYLYMARGSVSELDTQLDLANRLGYVSREALTEVDARLERIDKMLNGLIRKQDVSEK